eukprot:TRINITY_DN135_c0_g1_i1.p1 TRINITY_DN135_c0_g1~~TRINITY_DN135_c0_g1_i1.p1  ORF type:complete len:110 (-),score=22.10 TRINITY_DN135_c0_g1_i1:62-391(-)
MFESETREGQSKFKELDEMEKEELQKRLNKFNHTEGVWRFDRDPNYFEPILNYLRTGKLIYNTNVPLQAITEEAKFYELIDLERLIAKEEVAKKAKASRTARMNQFFDE